MRVLLYYCRICDKVVSTSTNNYKLIYRIDTSVFCNDCQYNGWRRCVICWKMSISDEEPHLTTKCSYCIKKPIARRSFMGLTTTTKPPKK